MTLLDAGNWEYKKSQPITSAIGSELTGYQVILIAHRASGTDTPEHVYLDTDCREDFGDVRFYDAENDVFFPYHLESVDGTTALFWVRLTSIPTTGKTMWVVYGDPASTSLSNPDNTYELWDDFLGSSIDRSKLTGEIRRYAVLQHFH